MNAFKDLTKLFTTYSIPVVSDFANRFRSGEMPIGIANYTIYNTLELFAPEIKGLWSIYELPGIVSEDGKINNTCLTYTNGTILMSHCKNKDVAWEFIKWWNSESSQYSYAVQLEALLGTSGRYPAANASVTEKLNWETTSLNALKQQFKKTVAMPVVPGNYMTSRMISNAYNEVVTDDNSINPKEALYLRIKQINDEITKKRKEFGLSYKENGKYYEGE